MSEQKTLSVLIPVGLPADLAWVKEKLPHYSHMPVEPIFLHVVDTTLLERLHQGNVEEADNIFHDLKTAAEVEIRSAKEAIGMPQSSVMIVEGSPSFEIIKISRDLQVDMIAMQIYSSDHHRLENLFFGSTTEQIIRGSMVPVICIP